MAFLGVDLGGIDLARGGRRILRNVSWRIRPRQRWVLLGHNGAGKTQLLKVLSGDVWPTPTRRGRRSWVLDGERHAEPAGLKESIAYVGAERQDQYSRYEWNLTVRDLVTTGLFGTSLVLDAPMPAGRKRVARTIERVGLGEFAKRRLLSLSYGEQRLALIARALVARPRLLLLDEPFNGLDAGRMRALMRFLESTKRSALPWVLAIHRREHLPRAATHLLVLAEGRVRYRGPMRSGPLEEFFGARKRSTRTRRAGRKAPALARAGAELISIRRADIYVDEKRVLERVDWTLREGEHWAIVGRNGSGKSTLVRLIYGDLGPALGGEVHRAGFPPGTPIEEFKKTVGLLSPHLQTVHASEDITVEEIVMSGRHASIGLNDAPRAADRRAAQRSLSAFGLQALARRRARELSYGQLRRVLLARAMVHAPRLLLLDEPCTGLDAPTRAEVLEQLEALARRGVQIVMATHHPEDLIPSINRVLTLHAGRAVAGPRTAAIPPA